MRDSRWLSKLGWKSCDRFSLLDLRSSWSLSHLWRRWRSYVFSQFRLCFFYFWKLWLIFNFTSKLSPNYNFWLWWLFSKVFLSINFRKSFYFSKSFSHAHQVLDLTIMTTFSHLINPFSPVVIWKELLYFFWNFQVHPLILLLLPLFLNGIKFHLCSLLIVFLVSPVSKAFTILNLYFVS